jgi:NAD(P)-dependent dehydrogenase (short-subunit alcohol dehydrogenase family)
MKRGILALLAMIQLMAMSTHAATVFITGSDRGLGLEFAKEYAARGDSVIATCRHPDGAAGLHALAAKFRGVVIEKLDVTDDAEIRSIAAKYKGKPIDVLINNAGVLGAREDQTPGTFNRKSFHSVMDVNAFGALAVSEALRANVAASTQRKIVAITSGLGSIALSGSMPKGPYYYRMSKAALDMGMQALGADLKSEGVVVAVVSPGVVETDMLAAFMDEYGVRIPSSMTVTESVTQMIGIIDTLDQAKAGKGIVKYDGTIQPW